MNRARALILVLAAAGLAMSSPPTGIGTVDFDHEMHYADLEIPCEECHHETNAKALDTPHPAYLDTASIDCTGCHRESLDASAPQSCAGCHPEAPPKIADETLSSKVVLHEVCWRCHDVGRGAAASRSCGSCHQAVAPAAAAGSPNEARGRDR